MNARATNHNTNRHGCLGKGLRLLGGLLAILILLGMVGACYERRGAARTAEAYPAPGQLVDVDGRTMHIHCVGEGEPTIVLDAGQGGWSSDWGDVMPQLSDNNRVCAYDRAGYGWSDSAENPTPQTAADDLSKLLTAAQIESPYLVVGFSHAGIANRIFAAQHAEQIAGMVLIDPATEFDNDIMSADLMRQQQSAVGMFKGFTWMANVGLLRLIGTHNMAGSAPFIGTDPADPDLYYSFIAAPQWWRTSAQEFESHLNAAHLTMVREQGAIADIPLIIIGSDVLDTTGNAAMDGLQAARHAKLSELAARSSQGQFIIASGSTHNIPSDRPDVILDAIAGVLAASK